MKTLLILVTIVFLGCSKPEVSTHAVPTESTAAVPAAPVPTVEQHAPPKPKMSEHTWSGSGAKRTEPFRVEAPWSLVWAAQPGALGIGTLSVVLYSLDGPKPRMVEVMVNSEVTGLQSGDTMSYTSGLVYLDINAVGKWMLKVPVDDEDKQ